MPSKKGGGDKQMHLHRMPFWWPCRGVEAIHKVSLDTACPWLPRKPLDAAIGRVFMLYRPSSHQGNSKQSNNQKMYHIPWPFWWPWQCAGMIPHASPDKGGSGLWRLLLVAATGQVSRPIVAISHAYIGFVRVFHCQLATKGLKLTSRPLITIGVWYINLMGMS